MMKFLSQHFHSKYLNRGIIFWFLALSPTLIAGELSREDDFPSVTRPWLRWWWFANAVDSSGIREQLAAFKQAGFGGVEITSIYGVKGAEERFLPYLSPAHRQCLAFAIETAESLGMRVDIPLGSGWRCGGPSLSLADADARLAVTIDTLQPGKLYCRHFSFKPQAVMAFADHASPIDLMPSINTDDALEWKSPSTETWTIYTAEIKWSGARVKRAAPGGEGCAVNPYSRTALTKALTPLDCFFEHPLFERVRCGFHDSFEYEGDWSDDFFDEFESRRGYDLKQFLPALLGHAAPEWVKRVKYDYRRTISELHLQEFIQPMASWCHQHDLFLRLQAHGSPGNLLDFYAVADIPETEIFARDQRWDVLKFASSAANLTGKKLVAAESFTWQTEHFQTNLDTLKRSADLLFAAGINHLIYHGAPYSPAQAKWPGWLFYAATLFNTNNPLWSDLPALNDYVTRCQSLLQASSPDQDVLIYWPIADVWSDTSGLLQKLAIHHPWWISDNPAGKSAVLLRQHGIQYDFISDALLKSAVVKDHRIICADASYRALVVPNSKWMPEETLQVCKTLAEKGARIIFDTSLPLQVPGFYLYQQREKLHAEWLRGQVGGRSAPQVDGGCFLVAGNLIETLTDLGISGESFPAEDNLLWLRRLIAGGKLYFIANHRDHPVDLSFRIEQGVHSLQIVDPLNSSTGVMRLKPYAEQKSVTLPLAAGQTLFLRFLQQPVDDELWRIPQRCGESTPLQGDWDVEFIHGGPTVPKPYHSPVLDSWTATGDSEAVAFAGTARYTLIFDAPLAEHSLYELSLGRVAESARVFLNDQPAGVLFTRPFRVLLNNVLPTGNKLEILVTNLAANRIRDLDRRGIPWRIFYDINFVNIDYQPFNAAEWPVRASGLLGPVELTPVRLQE